MKVHNLTGLRESLEQLQIEELQTMLQAELERETQDPDSVRLLLRVLEDRAIETPSQPTEQMDVAWQKYQQNVDRLKKPVKHWNMLTRVASVVLIVGVLFAVIPGQANAEIFWKMLQRWSTNLLEIVNPKEHISSGDYTFQTDNEGLQQVYDAVVALGITEPMVPMWLPEEFDLIEFTPINTPTVSGIHTRFSNQENAIIYKVALYNGEPAHQYYKDDTHYETYEQNGVTYNIARNNDLWVVVWTKENIESSIFMDCQEDTLQRILESIYEMEDS